jgi:exopolysaccharide production protein ExoQ
VGLNLPPIVALLLTVGFVIFLFRRDIQERPNITGALWLPVLWALILGSRSVAIWLNTLGLPTVFGSLDEGNPLDASVQLTFIVAGICVLNRRQVSLGEVLRNNSWLIAFLIYCFISIAWSDFPFVAFKRWIKILGHPIMALILLTEPNRDEALARLMKRTAYMLVPFSILFIKYYPEWGRGFSDWTGEGFNTGITTNKNSLGVDCFILGLFFFWHLLNVWRTERSRVRRNELLLTLSFLYMTLWLLWKANSATSLLSLLTGVLVIVLLGRRWVKKKFIGTYVLVAMVMLAVAELAFGIFGRVMDLTGHGTTLAGRGELWGELLALHTNPIFGVGFESFWLGDRLRMISEAHWWHPTEAHNGYLELYLDLGLVGLFMLVGLIIATFRKIRLELLRNFQFGRFRLGFLSAIVVYNWTEAAFRGLNPVWFIFYLVAMDYPEPQIMSAGQYSQTTGREDDIEAESARFANQS